MSVRCGESLVQAEMLTRTEPTLRRWKWERYPQCSITEAAGCGRGWAVYVCFQRFWVWGGRCDRSWSPFTSNYPLDLSLHHKDVLQDCLSHCTAWSWLSFQLFLCLVPSMFWSFKWITDMKNFLGKTIHCLFSVRALIPLKSVESCPVALMETVSNSHRW